MENRDLTHTEQIERWAKYVKSNPDWKKKFKDFSDAQIILARKAYAKLAMTPEGKEKIKRLREMKLRR